VVAAAAALLDLLLPRRCVACGVPAEAICGICRTRLRRITPGCTRCGAPTAWPVERCRDCTGRRIAFATARSAVAYDDVARLLVAAWKERGQRTLATLAAEIVAEAVPRPGAYTITFVPADSVRLIERGHNPAERLAKELARLWELPSVGLLRRRSGVRPQRGLSPAERRRNVKGVFEATAEVPRALALVDDVYTTGATVSAAASALRKGGARRVEIITFARVVR
jgi:ComF family protein